MGVLLRPRNQNTDELCYREEIREQQQIAEEIGNAIVNLSEPADESELLKELENIKQEQLDTQMLSAPSAPITATPQASKLCFRLLFFALGGSLKTGEHNLCPYGELYGIGKNTVLT